MKYSVYLLFLMSLLLLGCGSGKSDAPNQIVLPKVVYSDIPEEVGIYLRSKFPDFHIVNKDDYAASWWSFYTKTEVPYYVSSDFNNDSVRDHALILSNKKRLALVILLGSGASFTSWIAPDFNIAAQPGGIEYGLSIQPPAQIDATHPRVQSLLLKDNAVMLNFFEVHNRIYYFENKQFKVFAMSGKNN